MTVSTLFGAVLLVVYGLAELRRQGLRAVPEVATVAVLAGLLVLVLGVLKIGDAQSALQSPAFADSPTDRTRIQSVVHSLAFIVGKNGLPLILAAFLAARWKPRSEAERNGRDLAVLIIAVALLVGLGAALAFGQRISWEIRLRTANIPVVSIAIIGGYFLARGWREGGSAKLFATAAPLALFVLAMPSLVLATTWFGLPNDRNATEIPGDDLRVLEELRERSASHDVVWQYPEKPFLSVPSGRDSWSVVIAGRTNVAHERATDYAAAYPDIQRAYRYFAGEEVPIPVAVDWIYLSRTLHPQSYDALLARLERPESGWVERACYPDACIFERDPLR